MIFAFLLAFFAALANAISSLLQRAANRRRTNRPLVTQRVWLLGIGVAVFSFFLQAGALRMGSLAAIEPVLALELVFVVVGSGLFFHSRTGKQEWLSVGLMTGATVVLIVALDPQKHGPVHISALQWLISIGATVAVIAICLSGLIWARNDAYRAGLLGTATGVTMGLGSSLLKSVMLVIEQRGIAGILTAWQTYVALLTALFAFGLLQRALHAGTVVASQPGITLADPFVAILWGALIYHEKMNSGGAVGIAVLAAAVLTAGAILLAHAPALQQESS